MNISFQTLEITGYKGKPIPNTLLKQAQLASHAAIILPGMGYTAQMPLLYYVANLFVAQNADVLQVNYNYIDAFRGLDSTEQHRWLAADSDAAYRAFIAQQSYTRLTVVGKSLGTIAMAHLFATHDFSTPPTALWLTPVLTNAAVREQIAAFPGPSLVVIGTADSFYDPNLLAAIGETSTRHFAIIEGADHSMNVNDDVFQSLQALEQVLRAVENFLNH